MRFNKAIKPINFTGIIDSIEREGPIAGKYNNQVKKMPDYYIYSIKLNDKENKFTLSFPVTDEFSFKEGSRVSFKAFPAKEKKTFSISAKSMVKQLSLEEIQAISAKYEATDNAPEQPKKSEETNKRFRP